ncbi:MurT ligase domain-containing protein [Erysipelotrichaceae bacterium OttesenSCG-928-M19]|nr:MurT ligase domain-containing protein [Erysipelotrichaceae bacterium OttesenSCG-928-M19]
MAILLGKIAIKLSRMMGHRGSDVGGRIALKFSKRIFKKLISKIDTVILITGTNGKSTVTNLLAEVLEQVDSTTISNKTGANMYTGILSIMVEKYRFFKDNKIKYGVFEVDEGNVYKVMQELDHNYLVITNFFRDQLDRYSEMDLLIDKIKNSLENKDVKLIINADDPFCYRFNKYNYVSYGLTSAITSFEAGSISDSKYCPECGKELRYTSVFYGQLGHYQCDCGYNRPTPKYNLEAINNNEIIINNHTYHHQLKGNYNVYNLLAAISMLKELNISEDTIEKGVANYQAIGGRMQKITIKNNSIYLNLVKNHTGMNMTLQEAKNIEPEHIAFILNDNEGDGRDVSWIWDADFEYLLALDIEKYFVSGTRAYDMALRLKNMGIPRHKIVINNLFATLVDVVTNKDALVIVSYTALNETKKLLEEKGEVKSGL